MAYQSTPRIINLSELPEGGFDYSYSRASGELNELMEDLLQDHDYVAEVHIQPMGNAFELSGSVKTHLDLLCSRCAFEFTYAVDEKFRELLVIEDERPRNSQSTKSALNMEGPFCNYLTSPVFDIGEFIHEIVAAAEPYQPLGKSNCDDSCENYQAALKAGWLTTSEEQKDSPFSVLKDLKLKQ